MVKLINVSLPKHYKRGNGKKSFTVKFPQYQYYSLAEARQYNKSSVDSHLETVIMMYELRMA
jgi:hypothetical protein